MEHPRSYGLGNGRVAEGAPPFDAPSKLPAAVLSHGAGGSALNCAWLAEYLARNGVVTLGVSHFGKSPIYGPETIDWTMSTRFWMRPP